MKRVIVSALLSCLTVSGIQAAEYPAKPETLQNVLDRLAPGDTAILEPGVYYGPFTLKKSRYEGAPDHHPGRPDRPRPGGADRSRPHAPGGQKQVDIGG